MRTLLVDDEAHARQYLRDLLANHAQIEVIGEAENGLEAIEKINRFVPDLVFLDIQMPVLNGFRVLNYLQCKPLIVFCTAYDQFAIKAFETNALDYLLKPVTAERLAKSLQKVDQEWEKMTQFQQLLSEAEGLRDVVCHRNNAYHVFWLQDIQFFAKEGRYTAVQTELDGTFLTELTVDHLEKQIQNDAFFRINRATIIRRDIIRQFKIQTYSTGKIETADGHSFSVSRSRLQSFKQWFLSEDPA